MSYGLYDADLQFYPIPFYNLELMKLSSYYKHKREIVGLSPYFSPNKYKNFIVRQDFYNPYSVSYKGNNVTYGGRAFDGEKYKPLPLEIEKMQPDISLYSKVEPHQVKGYSSNALSTMRRAEHLRLSLDGITIWKDFEKQMRHDKNCFGMIFHDYNLNQINDAYELITKELSSWIYRSNGRRIGVKFPIQVDNKTDLLKWMSVSPMRTYFSLHYNGLIPNSYIPELGEIRQKTTTYKQASMDISKVYTAEELINTGLQRILRTIINLRSYWLSFSLIYDENLLIDDNWKLVMKLISRYNEHLVKMYKTDYFKRVEPFETLYSYCYAAIRQPTIKDPIFTKESIQSIFQFVRENNYELFRDFYEYRGGEVRNDRRAN